MGFMDKLVSGKELIGVKKRRSQSYIFEKFEYELQEKRESEGWIVDKELKSMVRMKRPKPLDRQFEDDVWCLFSNLGFSYMNKDRRLEIPYGTEDLNTTKQIDVFAADEETVLFIECKCAFSGKKGDFKTDLEAIKGIKEGLFKTVRREKEFKKKKVKYIFATKNYEITEPDRNRMRDLGIYHFDEYGIKYFAELAKHLGACARYQLLGTLFAGQKIGTMENRIPAIEGQMGGHTYYSFSIEPEKLLKLAYVLHRNEANSDMMPTYQRIIKKQRLKEIRKFIDNKGFFPNSLIISIDTNGKKLRFDLATPQIENAISRIGILYLPQLYRSVYIIDGQHRLYGYADSAYAGKDTIPVVAFVNLDKDKQVELLMEINENQKAVSKNLQNALKSTHFLTRFGKDNHEIEAGTFDRGSNDVTRGVLLPFLMEAFQYFKNELPEEWELGDANSGVLTINNTIHALLRILNDIIDFLIERDKINPKIMDTRVLLEKVEPYLAPLVSYFGSINETEREGIRKNYGSGGKARVWRTFQSVINEAQPEFEPDGLRAWIRDNSKQFNAESYTLIQDIELIIKSDFADKLQKKYGEKWLTRGIPPRVYKQANALMGKQNYENSINGINKVVDIWDCVTIANCRDIAIFSSNWTELFENSYTRPEEISIRGGKTAKTAWIAKFATIANNSNASYSFSEEEYLFLKAIHSWLNHRTLS